MKVIALLHGKTWALVDHYSRKLEYLPTKFYDYDDHYALAELEIMNYLYENTTSFVKVNLIMFEE